MLGIYSYVSMFYFIDVLILSYFEWILYGSRFILSTKGHLLI